MKCEICEATTEDLEQHYKEKHPNRIHELTKPEPELPAIEDEPPAEPVPSN